MSQLSQNIAGNLSLRQTGRSPITQAVDPILGETALFEASEPGVLPPRVVILTALAVEFLEVAKHVADRREIQHPDGTVYEYGRFTSGEVVWDVAIVETGQGNRRAATETQRAIAYFKPDVVLFVGVAGGRKDVAIGDVVAAEKVYNYESGRDEIDFKPRPEAERSSYKLEQRARAVARDWLRCQQESNTEDLPSAFVGAIAAGESVVASTESGIAQRLNQNYGDALAVEKESYGFLGAAREVQGMSALVVRGISDLLNGKETADKQGSQKLAARHASAFTFELLAKLEGKSEHRKDSVGQLRGDQFSIALDKKPQEAIATLCFEQYENCYVLHAHHAAIKETLYEKVDGVTIPIALGQFGAPDSWTRRTIGKLERYKPKECPIGKLLVWIQYLQQQVPTFSCLVIAESQHSLIPWELLNLGNQPLGIALQTVRSHQMSDDEALNMNAQMMPEVEYCCQGEAMVYASAAGQKKMTSHFPEFQSYAYDLFCHDEPEQVLVHLQKIERRISLLMMADSVLRQIDEDLLTFYLNRTEILRKSASLVMLQLSADLDGKTRQQELAAAFLEHGAKGVLGMLENIDSTIAQQIMNNFFVEYSRNKDLPIPELLRQLRTAIARQLIKEPTDEMARLYLATFLYAYYGHPMTVLQLTLAKP